MNDTELLETLHDEMLDLPIVDSTDECEVVDMNVKLGDVLDVFEKRLQPDTPNQEA